MPFFVLFAMLCWFYRDPERVPNLDNLKEVFLSPADGKVVEVERVKDDFVGDAYKVGIFMSVFDVHVNRSPCAGIVKDIRYVPGKKLVAFAPKSSEINERCYTLIEGEGYNIKICQIAGLLARRIVLYIKKGDLLKPAERFGMIKLGSKVDVYIPQEGVKLLVEVGQKVKAGISVIGVIDVEKEKD